MDDRGFILDSDAAAQDVYTKLHGEELRTLLLAPGKKGSPLDCEMQIVASPRIGQFEALSYVWGDTVKPKSISCNGFDFPVTESLHTALVHLRYPDSWRRLWVDQLSINQVEEKEELMRQIALMGSIFSSASRVIVWLGAHDRKMALAFGLLQETTLSSSLVRSDFLHSSPGPSTPRRRTSTPRSASKSPSLSRYSSRGSTSRESLASSTSSLHSLSSSRPRNPRQVTPPALKSALAIFQHVYFSRKWTFQEIVLSRAAVICCGDFEMAWSDLSLWYFHYAAKPRSSSLLYDSHGSFENIINVRNELDKGTLTLSNLLMLTRPRISTKPEDAVYALMGLVPDLANALKAAPHTTDPEDPNLSEDELLFKLYLKVFHHCLQKEHGLGILSAGGTYKGNMRAPNWPSWLPDWRQQQPLRPLVLAAPTDLGPESAFDEEVPSSPMVEQPAHGGPVYRLNIQGLHTPWQNSLTVYGICLGCIVTRPLSWPSTFLVADTLAQSRLNLVLDQGGQDQFSQSLASLAAGTSLSKEPSTDGYAQLLLQRSLNNGARCYSIRTSATVETGDWVCAFRGGSVLYTIRPVRVVEAPRQAARRGSARGRRHRKQDRSADGESNRYLFLGECAVHGLMPADVLDNEGDMLDIMLV